MWKLSPETEQQSEQLRESMDRLSFFSGTRKIAQLLQQVSSSGEAAAIPVVASGLFSPASAVHNASSNGIHSLLNVVPSEELIRLGEQLGGYQWGFVSKRWNRLQPQQVESYLRKTNDISVGNLLSMHKNGFVRHVAVKFLSNVNSGEELRFLLIRQNDWVDSIARDAQRIVHKKLQMDYIGHFARETNLLFRCLKFLRRDLNEVVTKYVDILVRQSNWRSLNIAIQSASKSNGRIFIRKLLERSGDHTTVVIRSGLESKDPIIRIECLKQAKDCLPDDELKAKLEQLLSDKFVAIRQAAYQWKSTLTSSPQNVWKQCMFDKSRSIRETAIFYLRKHGCNVANLYREKLAESPNSLAALSGLVSCSEKSDLNLFLGYLDCEFASRRAEAVRGIAKTGEVSDVVGLQKMLLDDSTRVVRVAYRQLLKVVNSTNPDSLFGLIEKCTTLAGINSILRLLVEQGKWESMAYLIRGSANQIPMVSQCSTQLLEATLSNHRVFTQPSSIQRIQIQKAANDCLPMIEKDVLRSLSVSLSSYGFAIRKD